MEMRLLVVTLLASSVACAVIEDPKVDLNDCQPVGNDVTLAHVEVSDPGYFAGEVGMYFSYPPKGSSSDSIITCVKVKDLLSSGTGSTATITSGGRGDTFVTIFITSKVRGEADFEITVLGASAAK